MFDWNDLKFFLAVAREGSTLAAAKALGVSQPTVQRRLAELERRIARRLVEHHPTGYRLTDLGRSLLPHAEKIEADVTAFERHLRASDDTLTGTIRITCPEADLDRLLRPVLERFRARHPGVKLEFLVSDRRLDLAKGEADIALRGGAPRDSALIGRKLGETPWALYASRDYVAGHGRPMRPEEIERHPVIIYTGPIADLQPARWFRTVAPNATIVCYSNSVLGALSAAKSGVGLALLPAHIGCPEKDLICVFEPAPELTEPVTLLVHPDLRNSPGVRAFLEFMFGEVDLIRSLLRGENVKS